MNKFYIQIVLLLLSIYLCVNNKTLATEFAPNKYTKPKSKKSYPANDNIQGIYEKNKHLLCTNSEEITNAYNFMSDAFKQLEYHATSNEGYVLYHTYLRYDMDFYKKKHKNTEVEKVKYIIKNPNKYNELLNRFWNPNGRNFFNPTSAKRKIVRVYGPNLVMIQQRFKKWPWSREKYFYAFAAIFQISKNKTMIVMASANIIDHNRKNKKYFENKIVESANLFQTEIDSEDDIRNGELKKMFVNLNGYIVEKKKKYIDITHVDSIVCHFINKHIFKYIFHHRILENFC
ncbi:fam-a protein [Plasmodium yoelii]|uniref:Fam-a protein n=1 Tax=Plasmodium yoelii TaxID=5861 RepID=A0A078K8T8_PLAYE|nr:fam-a protein [Plasmodium yoelii]CDU17361.1 fam-a protein [Plasmodium yoelii]VTZ76658.1 fam-a protein [Plasmodium yoelii]|eukprot:XP_022811870.1 fam-a protein [Plasmodium yoelii]